ncbi:LLM class flavin-dependent oxidoreductase [Pseudomonadales bacterium]|nr:LLM class flavin-dependent oxidoreductase [Pseudomonadales bacterium]MDA9905440.1 LLM class flavin-dependent oxidoreductase [Pseudomonadales bacterium]MDB0050465.1 LLM class flavin-dependent oxidoreductase [Pseudomonadales bacterium]MDC1322369.1 LLM class flavin-dependent oxidoreductase [Pseudomonadales bacterium]
MTVGAGIGIANFTFDDGKGFWDWVNLCDNGGIDSIWQSDRIIEKAPNLEVMSVMAALAGGSKKLKFGMNVASMGLRDPVLTAKACATIDVLSGGRLLPAFGVGSALSRDFIATGRDTKGRGKRTEESLQIMSALWREDSVNFEGEYYQLIDATISPKPVQSPMPLWVGGSAPQAIARTARWGTGWQAGIESAAEIKPVIEAIKINAGELGRKIDDDHFGAGFGFRFGKQSDPMVQKYNEVLEKRLGKDPAAYSAVGGVDEMMAMVEDFHASGAHKFILRPIASGTADMIEQTQMLVEQLLPAINALN